MRRKLKLGFWTALPIIFGVLFASLAFSIPDRIQFKQVPKLSSVNTATTEIKVKEQEIKVPNFITFAFAGDIMLDRGVKKSVIKNLGGDYNRLFENLAMLKNFDIVFANLEGPVSDKGKDRRNLYSFRMEPAILSALKNAGISIVSVANNHIGDWGREAYVDSLTWLKNSGILYTGGGMDSGEAETPTIIEKNGIKIGFLGFSDVGPDWMQAKKDIAGQLLARDSRFGEIIKNASAQVDHLIVSFHFGDEYKPAHNARQEYLAHKAIDSGAKIVIGHHPHVIEDTEIYKNGYIAYSLGNFIFDQSWSKPTMQGMLLEIKLSTDGSMTATKNTFKLNKFFQPGEIVESEEEKIISF